MSILERNYQPLGENGKIYITYEYWSNYHDKWLQTKFIDFLGDYLTFPTIDSAQEWISAREYILNI